MNLTKHFYNSMNVILFINPEDDLFQKEEMIFTYSDGTSLVTRLDLIKNIESYEKIDHVGLKDEILESFKNGSKEVVVKTAYFEIDDYEMTFQIAKSNDSNQNISYGIVINKKEGFSIFVDWIEKAIDEDLIPVEDINLLAY